MLGIYVGITLMQRKELSNMDILIGIVLVLLACKLLVELAGFFIGIKLVKNISKDWDK